MNVKNGIAAFVFIPLLCVFSCQTTTTNPNEAAAKAGSKEDSLYHQTMDIHNEVMAKMGKLMGYERQVQKQSDSIKVLLSSTSFTTEVARRIAQDVNTLDSLGKKLKAADNAMNDWMEQFDADPKMPTTEERAVYFADQKKKATLMRNQFFEALQDAETLMNKGK